MPLCLWHPPPPVARPVRSGLVRAAAPVGGGAAQLPDQRAPLQDQQDCDAEWMKQGARPALPEPEHERYARAVDARAGHRGCRDRRPRARRERYKKHKERQDVPAAEQQGPDRERQRLRHAFGGILRKALPDLPSAPIHPAAGEIGRVEQIGRAARPPEGSRQHEPVVPRAPDRGVTASPLIRVAAHRDQLAAARRERRVLEPPRKPDRQVAEQEHVDQRHDQRLGRRPRHLLRKAARQIEPLPLEQAGDAGEGIGREADVGVGEHQ